MISTIWFIVKASLLIALMMWVGGLGGAVAMSIGPYDIQLSLGMFAIIALFGIWVLSYLFVMVRGVLNTRKAIAVYQDKKAAHKGIEALSYGLSAVAAGDEKQALYYAKQAEKNIKDQYGVRHLISGMAYKMAGNTNAAQKSFLKMMNCKETSFIGLKGLLQLAMDEGDMTTAHQLAQKAYGQYPKHQWIVQQLYQLDIQNNKFDLALKHLDKLRKLKAKPISEIANDKAVLLLELGEVKKAYKADNTSLPIILAYARMASVAGKRRAVLNVIQSAWPVAPHPDLMDLWVKHAPKKATNDPLKMMVWVENLVRLNADDATSALYGAQMAARLGQNDTAIRFAKMALAIKPTMDCVSLLQKIDPQDNWFDTLAHASQDKIWVCRYTGLIYNEWKAITDEGHFNALEWNYPVAVQAGALGLSSQNNTQPLSLLAS